MDRFPRFLLVIFLLTVSIVAIYKYDIDLFGLTMRGFRQRWVSLLNEDQLQPKTEHELFVEKMEKLHLQRSKTLNETCCKFGKCIPTSSQPHGHDFYCDRYQYTVCWIQKCSYSSWLKATLVSDGVYTPGDDVTGELAISIGMNHTLGSVKDKLERKDKWGNYTNIILVRHPFERLVSAYNDKMIPVSPGFTPKGFEPISRRINNVYRKFRANVTERTQVGDGTATFEDFVNSIVRVRNPKTLNPHWMQYEHICDPCSHGYDVILKFDTYQDEFAYLKERLNVSSYHRPAFFAPKATKTDSNVTEEFITRLTPNLRRRLYSVYKNDFLLFGYEKPYYLT